MVEKLKAVERNRPASNTELLAVQEGIKVLETLVALGEEQNSKYFLIKATGLKWRSVLYKSHLILDTGYCNSETKSEANAMQKPKVDVNIY